VGLLVGGAASNLVDRALSGSVRDFIRAGDVVFNPADIAIIAGLVAYAIAGLQPTVRHSPREEVTT